MKNYVLFIFLFAIITMAFPENTVSGLPVKQYFAATDTLPVMCRILPSEDMRVLHPFTTMLTNIFPDDAMLKIITAATTSFIHPMKSRNWLYD